MHEVSKNNPFRRAEASQLDLVECISHMEDLTRRVVISYEMHSVRFINLFEMQRV